MFFLRFFLGQFLVLLILLRPCVAESLSFDGIGFTTAGKENTEINVRKEMVGFSGISAVNSGLSDSVEPLETFVNLASSIRKILLGLVSGG